MADNQSAAAVQGLQDAAADLQTTLVREITWFEPADVKKLDPVSVAIGFGAVLVSSFLAGFEEEARKAMKKGGRQSFRWLKGLAEDYFRKAVGEPEKQKSSGEEQEVAQLSRDAPNTAASLDAETYQRFLTATEEELTKELRATAAMPKRLAQELARKIRTAAEKHVLAPRRQRK